MGGWHYQFNGNELGKTPEDGEGQGGLVCCNPWDHRVGGCVNDPGILLHHFLNHV